MARIVACKEDRLTHSLAYRLLRLWDAYLLCDETAHGELLAEDYRAVDPQGSVRAGKPSRREMAAAPIEDYWLSELRAWPVGAEGAIVAYTAEIEVRSGLSAQRRKFAVGEVWMRHAGAWKCRYSHATMGE